MPTTLEHRIAALSPHWEIVKPDGPGPFPVVVQLHGCGGCKPFQKTWANVARDAGAAALIVDSHAHRAISKWAAYATVCTGAQLPGRERAGDLFAALAWLRQQSWADPNKLVAAGWSHGGWTIADALSFRDSAEMARATGLTNLPVEPLDGLAATFLLYPYLGIGVTQRAWRMKPRTLAVLGGKDSVAGGRAPLRLLERAGAPLTIEMFETATHAFDEPDARDIRVRYDPALVARAHGLFTNFLGSL